MATAVSMTAAREEHGKHVVPGPILLLGAPGVGKGTQSEELVKLWGIPHISTGNLLRAHRDRGTALGKLANELMNQGNLVPDELMLEMVDKRLAEPDTERGFILDGFPRTLNQAKWVDHLLASRPGTLPLVAVSIQVDYNQLLRRISGRRNCPVCGTIYNIYFHPPKVEGVCDVEGATLEQRSDDTETCFAGRLTTYESLTAPVVERYRALSRFVEVNGDQPVEQVATSIISSVERLRA